MKTEQKKLYAVAAIALIIGLAGGSVFARGHRGPGDRSGMDHKGMPGMERSMQHGEMGDMKMQMDGMTASLNGKTGEEFDRAFLEQMIVHHQGAVDMAQMQLKAGVSPELKTFSQSIINVQTKEIVQMKEWLEKMETAATTTVR